MLHHSSRHGECSEAARTVTSGSDSDIQMNAPQNISHEIRICAAALTFIYDNDLQRVICELRVVQTCLQFCSNLLMIGGTKGATATSQVTYLDIVNEESGQQM